MKLSIKSKYVMTTLGIFITFSLFMIILWSNITSRYAENVTVVYANDLLVKSNNALIDVLKDVYSVATIIAMDQDTVMNALDNNIEEGTNYIQLTRDVRNLLSYLTAFKPYINGVMIFNKEGESFNTGTIMSLWDLEQQEWYDQIIQAKQSKIIINPHEYDIYLNRSSNYKNKVISVARPITNYTGTLGYVIADIKCESLINQVSANLDALGSYVIYDESDTSFVLEAGEKLPLDQEDIRQVDGEIKEQQGHLTMTIHGESYLIIYERFDYVDWTSLYLVPKRELTKGFKEGNKIALWFSIIICGLGICIIYVISNYLTQNIYKLKHGMEQISEEQLDVAVQIHSGDEIEELSNQFNALTKRVKGLITDIKATEEKKRQSELKALQAQINPHFLMNTLNTIKFLSVMEGTQNITKVSDGLSSLMYMYLDHRHLITLDEESGYLKNYLDIQGYKYRDQFSYKLHVEPELKDYKIMKLLIQPLVENALVHGIQSLTSKGVIVVKVYKEDGKLKVVVQDNGSGLSAEEIDRIFEPDSQHDGIGLQNVMSRIQLHYGDTYGIHIESEPYSHTLMEVTLPLIKGETYNEAD